MPKNDANGSNRQDWRTPRGLYDRLNARYSFELDAAASPQNALCPRYWTEADDALTQPWHGRTYVNPPYNRIAPWTKKAAEEYANGHAELVVMLLPSSTDALWLHKAVNGGALMIPIPRRLKFDDSSGCAPFGSMLLIWGERESPRAHVCQGCNEVFLGRRQARTCSNACRMRCARNLAKV